MAKPWTLPKYDPTKGPRCFQCNEYGHIASLCPGKAKPVLLAKTNREVILQEGLIEDQYVRRMAVDTGASVSIVHRKWVPQEAIRKDRVRIASFAGHKVCLLTAELSITVYKETVRMWVAIHDSLDYDAIVGIDVPAVWENARLLRHPSKVMMVTTRGRAKQQTEQQKQDDAMDEGSEADPTPLDEQGEDREQEEEEKDSEQKEETDAEWEEERDAEREEDVTSLFPFDNDIFLSGKSRTRQSRDTRRRVRKTFSSAGQMATH